jgi:hypothetical protein
MTVLILAKVKTMVDSIPVSVEPAVAVFMSMIVLIHQRQQWAISNKTHKR